jgi:membrane associated rhomboid family serine protease
MIFLYIFGDNIEDRFGHIKYLAIYFFCGLFATLVHSIYAVSIGGGEVLAMGGFIAGVGTGYAWKYSSGKKLLSIPNMLEFNAWAKNRKRQSFTRT